MDPAALPDDVVARLRAGTLIPYLGPGLAAPDAPAPMTTGALAKFLGSKVTLPKRAIGNPWAAAQFIEGRRHRATLTALMAEAFAPPVAPTPLQAWLATLAPPMIVDTWYDGAMRSAFGPAADWGEIQGITRAGIGEHRWWRAYDAAGQEVPGSEAGAWRTLLYKPHGGIVPARNFLVADSDYVEVLTEIDIQTPIPAEVQARREGRGFLFLGCRFDDQLLRTYARQIAKRSAGPHVAVLPAAELTRMELHFVEELAIRVIPLPPAALHAA